MIELDGGLVIRRLATGDVAIEVAPPVPYPVPKPWTVPRQVLLAELGGSAAISRARLANVERLLASVTDVALAAAGPVGARHVGEALAEVRSMLDGDGPEARGVSVHEAIEAAAAAIAAEFPEGTIPVRTCPGCDRGFGAVLPVQLGDVFHCEHCGGSWRLDAAREVAGEVDRAEWHRVERTASPSAAADGAGGVPRFLPTWLGGEADRVDGGGVRLPMSARGDSFPGEE